MTARDISPQAKPAVPATRNTVQRALVLNAVRTLQGHPTSSDVYEAVRQEYPHISRATVYRNLNLLAERGELRRVEVPNGADRYDVRTDPHYYLLCTACGRVFDADMPYHPDLASELGDTDGFNVTGHILMFTGTCADCRAAAREAAVRG